MGSEGLVSQASQLSPLLLRGSPHMSGGSPDRGMWSMSLTEARGQVMLPLCASVSKSVKWAR